MDKDVLGISPELMKQAEKLGECFRIEILKHRSEGRVEIRYMLTAPCSAVDIGKMADELANQLAWGHHIAFGMKGTIAET